MLIWTSYRLLWETGACSFFLINLYSSIMEQIFLSSEKSQKNGWEKSFWFRFIHWSLIWSENLCGMNKNQVFPFWAQIEKNMWFIWLTIDNHKQLEFLPEWNSIYLRRIGVCFLEFLSNQKGSSLSWKLPTNNDKNVLE